MSQNLGHASHTAHQAKHMVDQLGALAEKKNPLVAALLGGLFGAIGVGIYFRSWKDFFVCIFVFVVLTIAIPAIGSIPGWLFAAGYGFYRANSSNDRLTGATHR